MRDIAIYSPGAARLYSGDGEIGAGGAELQTTLLARALASRGLDVAHIVYPIVDPVPQIPPCPTPIERRPPSGGELFHAVREFVDIWPALSAADARVVIVRGSGGYVVPSTIWCAAHRRAFVFSTSNDLDFDLHRPDRRRSTLRAYAAAARRARGLVVQTETQAELARKVFPSLTPTVIPSFAESAPTTQAEPRYFLWSDRLTDYKRPEKFLDLAAALPETHFRMVATETLETSMKLRDRLHARAESLPNLELLPGRPRAEALKDIEGAIAVVKTSEVEGMPNAFLEAWARGVPVLSLSVDPDQRIADRGVGLLAEGSMERLVAEARRLRDDQRLREEIGTRGREFVREHHSVEAVAERWEGLLASLLA